MGDGDRLSDIGVVIVTYRSAATIGATLDALPVGRLGAVVVVDNASLDDTVATVRRHPHASAVTIVESHVNAGFGAGCNAGVATLTACREVLFLNPDAVIDATQIENLARYLDAHPVCALVAPRMFQHGRATFSAGRDATLASEVRPLLPRAIGRVIRPRRHPVDFEEEGPVGYTEGACMLVRRDAFRGVGGFDERYFLYFEELDIAHRLREAGYTVDLCPSASCEHVVGASTQHLPVGARPHLVESTVRYLATRRGHRAAKAYVAAARASWWLRTRTGRLDGESRAHLLAALTRGMAEAAS